MTAGNDGRAHDRSRTTLLHVRMHGKDTARTLSVFCPRRLEVLDTAECSRCDHCDGLSFDPVDRGLLQRCAWQGVLQLPAAGDATTARLGDLVRAVEGVAADAELESVRALFAAGSVDAAPVVDRRQRPIGIVTKGDLLRWYGTRSATGQAAAAIRVERSTAPRVREAMSHLVYTLHAGADLARAAALMAYEDVHQIVVTREDGRLLGLVSSLDILRWLARDIGYVVSEVK